MFAVTRAPELDRAGLEWLNAAGPLSLEDLRGRIVVLDFWTFCCINCLHALKTLKRIEETFPKEVVVLGVHSPKFAAERDVNALRQAVLKCDITHPVVHDPAMTLWDAYAIRAWPTLVILNPDGDVICQSSGEPDAERLIDGLRAVIATWRGRGAFPDPFPTVAPAKKAGGRLSFPGKIKKIPLNRASPCGALWAVADPGHNQIVILDDRGREIRRFGEGGEGFADGPASRARFSRPQGLSATAAHLYVADTGNHALREVSLKTGRVRTLAGRGRRGAGLKKAAPALEAALASPWDVEIHGRALYFANAGTHQIGLYDLSAQVVSPLAGAGGENIVDGAARNALLAQPSALALDAKGNKLYFADAETSSIRVLDLAKRRVETLVGRGLFDYGHADGAFEGAKFQHPLGLCLIGDYLIVADSYNNALRIVDHARKQVCTLGCGETACVDAVCRPYAEPAGVWAACHNRILVSDTNHHRILELKLDEQTLRTWFE